MIDKSPVQRRTREPGVKIIDQHAGLVTHRDREMIYSLIGSCESYGTQTRGQKLEGQSIKNTCGSAPNSLQPY